MAFSRRLLTTVVVFASVLHVLLPRTSQAQVLRFIDSVRDVPIDILRSAAVSPDGRHVYVLGNGLALLDRDPDTGRMSLNTVYYSNETKIDFGSFLVMSADGRHLYAIGSEVGSAFGTGLLSVLERDLATGALRLLETHRNYQDAAIPDPFPPRAEIGQFVLGRDGDYLHALFKDSGLTTFARDPVTGTLREVNFYGATGAFYAPLNFKLSPDGRHIYVLSLLADVRAFEIELPEGVLRFIDVYGYPPASSCACISPDGRHVYIQTVDLGVYARDASSGELTLVANQNGGDFPGVGDLTFSSDGRHAYDRWRVFERDVSTGLLTHLETPTGFEDVYDVLLSPDERFVLTTSSRPGGAVLTFARDATTGLLSFVESFRASAIDDVEGLRRPEAVAVSPDGRHVYVSGADATRRSLTLWRRVEGGTGLELVTAWYDDTAGFEALERIPRMVMTPDGRYLYAVKSSRREIDVFARDTVTGFLSHRATIDFSDFAFGHFAEALTITPDGRNLYAVSGNERRSGILILSVDPGSGALGFVQALGSGRDEPEDFGIPFARGVSVSPDGRHVHVAGSSGHPAAFARDTATGALSLISPGAESPFPGDVAALEASPDGRHLYQASTMDGESAITVFERVENGRLRFVERLRDGEDGIHGLGGLADLLIPPDGAHVFALGSHDSTLAVFERNAVSGKLQLAEVHVEGEAGVDGLLTAGAVAMDPGGNRVYAISREKNAIAVFGRAGECGASDDVLCLDDRRFEVRVRWRDFDDRTGVGRVVPLRSDDSGLFWFFAPENWELLVKILDGCALTDHFWVFSAATTNVEYTLEVTDLATGVSKSYFNPLGVTAPAVTDVLALPVCDDPARRPAGGIFDLPVRLEALIDRFVEP